MTTPAGRNVVPNITKIGPIYIPYKFFQSRYILPKTKIIRVFFFANTLSLHRRLCHLEKPQANETSLSTHNDNFNMKVPYRKPNNF